ncbi:unnamed protein product [Sphagnum jensenii]|uniref:Uncharacterized protein n=1 Tax=Sphagnum jensenii TaxID=128206 RepID=A0ABP1AYD0_9BRYO
MTLAINPAPGRCPLLRVHRKEGLHQHTQIEPHVQYEVFPSRPQPHKHLYHSNDGQTLAQRPPTEGGHTHLAGSQQRPPGWVLAPTNRHALTMQSVQLQHGGNPSTLPLGLPNGATHLGSLQKNLDEMASASRSGDHLALHATRRNGDRAKG